jgi:hypothetical protein
MSTAQDTGRVYALLADGTTVEIRQASPDDLDAVQALHEAMAPDNIYLRFFSYSRRSAETEARRICREPAPEAPGSAALLALLDGELVGVASYAGLIGHPGQAEVAFAVATTCTTRASRPCCSSIWSHWPTQDDGAGLRLGRRGGQGTSCSTAAPTASYVAEARWSRLSSVA